MNDQEFLKSKLEDRKSSIEYRREEIIGNVRFSGFGGALLGLAGVGALDFIAEPNAVALIPSVLAAGLGTMLVRGSMKSTRESLTILSEDQAEAAVTESKIEALPAQ